MKTLAFTGMKRMRNAARDLAAYIVNGREPPPAFYEGEEDAVKIVYGQIPQGLALGYVFYLPMSSPFSDYYSGLHGGRLEYALALIGQLSVHGGIAAVFSTDNRKGNAFVLLGSGYAGASIGLPLFDLVYIRAGADVKFGWFLEMGGTATTNLLFYVADVLGGVEVRTIDRLYILVEGGYGFRFVNDNASTDVSGVIVGAGCRYSF